jgi:hypothetical protein
MLVPPERRFLQEPHGVTSQKTPFFIVNAVKTSNLTLQRDVSLLHSIHTGSVAHSAFSSMGSGGSFAGI